MTGPRGGSTGGARRRPTGRRFQPRRRRACRFCVDKIDRVDFKDVGLLRRYVSDRARIEPRRKTAVCARHQRVVSTALKRARFIALIPYTEDHVRHLIGVA